MRSNITRKPNSSHSSLIQQLYGWACERLYHEFAWGYDLVSWVVSAGRWNAWRGAALDFVRGPTVLELGFGTGELLIQLSDAGVSETLNESTNQTAEIHGIDLSPEMHEVAQSKIWRRHGASPSCNPHLVLADAQTLPYPDGYFETIVSTFPAPYILDPATLRECVRLLKPVRTLADNAPSNPSSRGRLVIVGMWVSPRRVGWLRHFPVFFGSPDADAIEALAQQFRSAGLEARFETFADRWADVSVVIAEPLP